MPTPRGPGPTVSPGLGALAASESGERTGLSFTIYINAEGIGCCQEFKAVIATGHHQQRGKPRGGW